MEKYYITCAGYNEGAIITSEEYNRIIDNARIFCPQVQVYTPEVVLFKSGIPVAYWEGGKWNAMNSEFCGDYPKNERCVMTFNKAFWSLKKAIDGLKDVSFSAAHVFEKITASTIAELAIKLITENFAGPYRPQITVDPKEITYTTASKTNRFRICHNSDGMYRVYWTVASKHGESEASAVAQGWEKLVPECLK